MTIMNDADRMVKAVVSKLRIKQLQLLIALSEHKSLRKAATAMFMTQSAASKALQEIESMLGVTLFERTRAGLVPNAMGHCAIRYATLISSELTCFCREVEDIRTGAGGSLVIGTIMGAVPRILVSALASLRAAYPNLSIEIIEGTSSHLLKLLDDGRIDLMIGRPGVSAEPYEYSYYPVSGEPTSVVVGSRHPEVAGEMSFAQLRGFRWVVYPRRMPLRILLEKEMNLAGLSLPASFVETDSTFVTVAILGNSVDTAALLPTEVADMFTSVGLIRILPIDLKVPADTYGIVTRKTGTTTAVVQLLIDAARNHTLVGSRDPISSLPATWT
ncbi:LysR substrate-binding domain-containing protein [Castellaniella sp. UC4442_H9]|jgi:DNA-binding transcriptional LysR family regulator